ncbi:phage minor head protein [Maritimibacter sp. HL-12]|uniref:phage head morphogenesis protein n=1 Tax=Maritimibacter sp. HL-12 TaxID=1162418 RepID=UPI000A0F2321|nr:phage minor head protein [Maritimibacter sp. HL-12]SMH35913.1 Uncharacterized protein, homolog of phage Mu protein gp30 [Maritimibacter sp. HL-12]
MPDFTDQPGYSFTPGPPPEASRFLRNKGMTPSFSWEDVEPEEHAVAFTVAKAMELDVLTAIREELQKAVDEGLPFATFQKQLRPRLQELGWWGKSEVIDPLTGELVKAQLGSPRRLRTIYRANLASARSAGQWERIQRSKDALPYLEYRLGPSEVHREHHADKEGLVLPADHPFWQEWMPPNGWGCKCWVKQLTQRQAEAKGISADPDTPLRRVVNKRTGEVKDVPVGIDPGWERNPGQQRLDALERLTEGKLRDADPQVARSAMRDMASSWRARRVLAGEAPGTVPVAMLDETLRGIIGSDTAIVRISEQTALKQVSKHPEISPKDYVRLVELIEGGRVIRVDERNLAFLERTIDLPWIAVIKRTVAGDELYLTTFYKLHSARYLRRLLERGEVVRE